MDAAVPGIEIADDAHARGIGRPHGKLHATHAGDFADVGAQRVVELVVGALADQVQVKFGQHRREGVGVGEFADVAVLPADTQAIIARPGRLGDFGGEQGLEDSAGLDALGRNLTSENHNCDLGGMRLDRANHESAVSVTFDRVRPEVSEWVAMFGPQQKLRIGCTGNDLRAGQSRMAAILD